MTATSATHSPLVPPVSRSQWVTEPFIMGGDEDFRRLREWLVAARYTEAGLAEGAIGSTYEFAPLGDPRRKTFLEPIDKQSLLVQLFLDGLAIAWDVVNGILSADDRAVFDALGLLQTSVSDPAAAVGTVALYPLEGLYMVSDRYGPLQVSGGKGSPSDLVYSALTPETHRFVELMPRYETSDYLELCSGCGVAALIAGAKFAKTAYAVDITPRSTRFAQFNARLNDLANVVPIEGNLYDPVAGKQFDLITAHPPYVASFDNEMIFRDAGEDGEQISRAIFAGLADHLKPGGQFYCDCTMTDREDAPLEQRIRAMLGPKHEEFDVLVGQVTSLNPVIQYAGGLVEGRSTPELFAQRVAAFKRLNITSFVAATILIQRRASNRPVVTRRRIVTGRTTAADFQWLMNYLVVTSQWTEADVLALLDTAPRTLDGTQWQTRMLAEGSEWKLASAQLSTTAPFSMEADNCPPWFATLLTWCDGRTAGREHLRRLREAGMIPPASDDRQFAVFLKQLADAAFVELPALPLPPR